MLWNKVKRGPGVWRFNNLLLDDPRFNDEVTQLISDLCAKFSDTDPVTKWDAIKFRLCEFCKKFSIKRAADIKANINRLENEYKQLLNQFQVDTSNSELWQMIELLRIQIDDYYEDKAKSAAFRARCRWLGDGEKSSKYFFSLEKSNYEHKTMKMIEKDNGSITHDPHEILELQYNFYSTLYTSDSNVIFEMENTTNCKISLASKELLEKDLTINELTAAVFSMKNDKAPGCDGLSVNFYKHFWKLLSSIFYEMTMYAMSTGNMPKSSLKGYISLLPKKNKNPLKIQNWRPLTMLNNDYKIISKALAIRLKHTLDEIISEDQTGFMKGRQISQTIRKSLDIIEYLESRHKAGYLLSLDYVKCFDKIEINSILGALKYFGYGERFTKMIEIMQLNFQSCVTNNGYLSPWFDVTRSTHQGDPQAAYLFLLCGEVMSHIIKQNSDISPLEIRGVQELISQFADDTQLFETEQRTSLEATAVSMRKVQKNLGLEINFEKSKIHLIGPAKDIDYKTDWHSTREYPVILGIDTNPTSNQFFEILNNGNKILEHWKRRGLSLMGKILIVNTLFVSLFVYAFQVLEDPQQELFDVYNECIKRFLWNDKKEKIKISVLQGPREGGGLKLCNLFCKLRSLKIAWIFRQDAYTCNMFNCMIPDALGTLFWDCNLKKTDVNLFIPGDFPRFWKQICYHWFEYQGYQPKITSNQILWCNSSIRINEKPVLFSQCAQKGLIYIYQLFTENGEWKNPATMYADFSLKWYEYRQIRSAIGSDIDFNDAQSQTAYDQLRRLKNKTKKIYTNCIAHLSITDTLISKYPFSVSREELETAFKDLYVMTNITKYRDFQYRLLNLAIYANNVLFYWKKVDSQCCDWCDFPKQTVQHMLFECPFSCKVFKELTMFINNKQMVKKPIFIDAITYKMIVLGRIVSPKDHIVNFLFLITKQYIFAAKCLNIFPCFNKVKEKIFSICKQERYNATKHDRLERHKQNWAPFFGNNTDDISIVNYIQQYLSNI